MKISVITICYNNGHDLEKTIKSVLGQKNVDFEYIVVDGGSSDETLNVIEGYKDRIDYFISEKDRGIYDAINKGIDAASGEIIGMIHGGDELYDDGVLSGIYERFRSDDIDGVYGHSEIQGKDGKVYMYNVSPEFKRRNVFMGWFPSHQSIYVKKNCFIKYGKYNLDYQIAGDYEWFLRLFLNRKLKFVLHDYLMVRVYVGGVSSRSLRNRILSNYECMLAWKNNGYMVPVYLFVMKPMRKVILRMYRFIGKL